MIIWVHSYDACSIEYAYFFEVLRDTGARTEQTAIHNVHTSGQGWNIDNEGGWYPRIFSMARVS